MRGRQLCGPEDKAAGHSLASPAIFAAEFPRRAWSHRPPEAVPNALERHTAPLVSYTPPGYGPTIPLRRSKRGLLRKLRGRVSAGQGLFSRNLKKLVGQKTQLF